jgi:protein disulfide-isomerase
MKVAGFGGLMRRFAIIWLAGCLALPRFANGAEWTEDYHAALDRAQREHKFVLLDFTGSDWCGWCKKLKSDVFDQPEFGAFADANLVLVEVDFPREKPQSAEQKEVNESLGKSFHVNGYPTIVVLDQMGNKLADQVGYMAGGPQAFIGWLERIPGMKHVDDGSGAVAAHQPPAFVPIGPGVAVTYGPLTLKALSGGPGRRVALINNETFMTGDTAKVKVDDRRVEVCCKEIRKDSVLITADGKPMELWLDVQ